MLGYKDEFEFLEEDQKLEVTINQYIFLISILFVTNFVLSFRSLSRTDFGGL